MSAQDDQLSRSDYDEMVNHPGKFEGEEPYTPYFYEKSLEVDDGYFAQYGGGYGFRMAVSRDDVDLFPELSLGEPLHFYENVFGFVSGVTAEEWYVLRNEAENEDEVF